jgi:hypothetical protein
MLSWVFRHRARLGVLYGLTPPPAALAPAPPAPVPAAEEVEEPRTVAREGAAPEAPGTWSRRERWVVLRPMARRSA